MFVTPGTVERRGGEPSTNGSAAPQHEPDRPAPLRPAICVVAEELAYLFKNGGIGTANWQLAQVLRSHGWRVHVLYCGTVPDEATWDAVSRRLTAAGCSISRLDDFELPAPFRVPDSGIAGGAWAVAFSNRVAKALEELHRLHHFDVIEFADYHALGFRPIQARRTGLAFADVAMAVKLHSPSHWVREANLVFMGGVDDLSLDYCERYAFEHADIQLSPCRYMLEYVRSLGWKVRDDARVVSYAFPAAEPGPPGGGPISEVVFFGRLETRKGLEVFLEAARHLKPDLRLSFLGREAGVAGGRPARELIADALGDRLFAVHTDLDQEQAQRYLREGNRLAVIASLVDNFPNTVIECAAQAIPFVAAGVGGIPEIVADPELRAALLFDPNPRALLECLTNYLDLPPERRDALGRKVRELADPATVNRRIFTDYCRLVTAGRHPTASPSPVQVAKAGDRPPLVTVGVTYYNLPEYLPETLASLAAQTYDNLEVVVLDDGSTNPAALRVFEEQRRRYPQFRFLSQANGGLSAARNRCLAEARGEYFLPVDADNIARPHMVEALARGLRRNPQLSALSCFFLAFQESGDLQTETFPYAFRPVGGALVLASLGNACGDANSIFRVADLRAVGGYGPERDSTCEDWEAFVKLLHAGYQIDVVPDHLYYYRHRADSLIRSTSDYRNHKRVLRHFFSLDRLPPGDGVGLWTTLVSLHKCCEGLAARVRHLEAANAALSAPPDDFHVLNFRLVKWLNDRVSRVPLAHRLLKRSVLLAWRAGKLVVPGRRR